MTRLEAIFVLAQIKKAHETMPKFIRRLNEKMAEERIEALDFAIENLSAEAVSKGVLEQFRWERDVAMDQLEEYGIPFCTNKDEDIVKVVRCKDCIHRIDRRSDLGHFMCEMFYGQGDVSDENFCQWGERREPCD